MIRGFARLCTRGVRRGRAWRAAAAPLGARRRARPSLALGRQGPCRGARREELGRNRGACRARRRCAGRARLAPRAPRLRARAAARRRALCPPGRPRSGRLGARARARHQQRAVDSVAGGDRGRQRGGRREDSRGARVEEHEAERASLLAESAQVALQRQRSQPRLLGVRVAGVSERVGDDGRADVPGDERQDAPLVRHHLGGERWAHTGRGCALAEERHRAARALHHAVLGGHVLQARGDERPTFREEEGRAGRGGRRRRRKSDPVSGRKKRLALRTKSRGTKRRGFERGASGANRETARVSA